MPNGFELRRLGTDHHRQFQHPYHTTMIANRAASPVASSELLGGKRFAAKPTSPLGD